MRIFEAEGKSKALVPIRQDSPAQRHTQIQSVFLRGFQGGWRPDLNPTQAEDNIVTDLLNVVWEEGYALATRGGYEIITADVTDQDTAEFMFAERVYTTSGLFPSFSQQVLSFNEDDGYLFYQSLGALQEEHEFSTGSDLVAADHSLGSAANTAINYFRTWPIVVQTGESKIYMTSLRYGGSSNGGVDDETESGASDGASLPIIYDVQAGSFSRPDVHALDGTDGGFPRARCLINKYARMFAANLHSQGTYRYPSRVYWSGEDEQDEFQPEVWESLNYFDVGSDDGSEITALLPFGEQILIFKNNSVWTLTGTDETTFSLFQLDDHIGTEATFGVDAYAGRAFFFDYRTGVWSYDGAEFNMISEPVRDKLLGEVNQEAAFKANLDVFDQKLYLSIPVGSGTADRNTVTYVYDLTMQVWTRWDIGWVPSMIEYFTDFAVTGAGVAGDGFAYVGGIDDELGLMKLQEVDTDNNTTISAHLETGWLNPGEVGDKHRIRRLEVILDKDSDDVDVTLYRDLDDTSWHTGTIAPDDRSVEWHEQEDKYDTGFWTWLKLRLENASATDKFFRIDGVAFSVSSRVVPRGRTRSTDYKSLVAGDD